MTGKGLGALANSLKELQNLTFLALTIQCSNNIDEGVIEEIAEALYCLPSLYSTSFSFFGCRKLKEKEGSLKSLWKALWEMRSIQKVTLDVHTIAMNEKEVSELKKRKIVRSRELW